MIEKDKPEWKDYAACKNMAYYLDPTTVDTYVFPEEVQSSKAKYFAHRFCATCPVIHYCYDYAKNRELLGVWGGARFTGRGNAMSDYTSEEKKERRERWSHVDAELAGQNSIGSKKQ